MRRATRAGGRAPAGGRTGSGKRRRGAEPVAGGPGNGDNDGAGSPAAGIVSADARPARKSRRVAAVATAAAAAVAPPATPVDSSSSSSPPSGAAAAPQPAGSSQPVDAAAAGATTGQPSGAAPPSSGLLELPPEIVEVVAARLTLLDRARLAASSAHLWRLLSDDVALCAITMFLGHDAEDAWQGPYPGACHPTVPAPTAAAGGGAAAAAPADTPHQVRVAGVVLSRADAVTQGRGLLRALTLACEHASESLCFPSAIRHIAECHPDGQLRLNLCPHVNRVALSRSAARSLLGIPAAWAWRAEYGQLERRTKYGWYMADMLRDVLREAFWCRTPTGGGADGVPLDGGPFGMDRIAVDLRARHEAAAKKAAAATSAADDRAATVERLIAERVADGGHRDGGGSSSGGGGRSGRGGRGGRGSSGGNAATAAAHPPRPTYARWIHEGAVRGRSALAAYMNGVARASEAAAAGVLDDFVAVYDGLDADLHAFYDGCTRASWRAAATTLAWAAQEASKAKPPRVDVAATIAALSRPRARKTWTGLCWCCHRGG
ncbi:hypothetical protein BU14_0451s0001 [Porphyra umbilicalis]|uniref:F-box domain-containing protein n=1 Tax=Porphyra umbilicalis TaxID=2786 RepID=A0A1X6NUG9_PORUM|nr:hypothetical protein BU14_0451s0001 [Porphyra umbilicalis]|eukprot:OSX72274.1 hypothetical protein BU14_0451s0001 [Porphyra umbilicalis]